MRNIFTPKAEIFEKIKGLMYGFLLDVDSNDNCILILKLEASLIDCIINGKAIELVLRNPKIKKRSCTFYIYDREETPFFYTGQNFSDEDKVFIGFDEVAIKFARTEQIEIALFNELSHCIFATTLKIQTKYKEFENWLYKIYNNPDYKLYFNESRNENYFPESEIKGFTIAIENLDNSKAKKLTIITSEFGDLEEESEWVSFNHEEYQANGKHGYHQELSISNNLSRFFTSEINYFINPFNEDETEFIDFVVIYKDAVMLIESKYIISDKPTMRNKRLLKAVTQLNKAEELILTKKVKLKNEKLSEILNNSKYILKVCLLNNKTVLTDDNTKNITKIFVKEFLPFFTSVSVFFQLLTSLSLKNPTFFMENIFFNIKNIHTEYLNSNMSILYFDNFSVEGLSPEELNKIGGEIL